MKFRNNTNSNLHIYEHRFVKPHAEFELSDKEQQEPLVKVLITRRLIQRVHNAPTAKEDTKVEPEKSVDITVNITPEFIENNNITGTTEEALGQIVSTFIESEIISHKSPSEESVKAPEVKPKTLIKPKSQKSSEVKESNDNTENSDS